MIQLVQGDARNIPLPNEIVQCVVTSPPYWGLRDYGLAAWEGGDPACNHKVGRFEYSVSDKQRSNDGSAGHQARSICPKCGGIRREAGIGLESTLDEYIENMRAVGRELWRVLRPDGTLWLNLGDCYAGGQGTVVSKRRVKLPFGLTGTHMNGRPPPDGLKPKDLIGLPWRVAFALQADGWYLRSDIIWAKPNPMPESVRDRPTRAHEYLFLLTKSAKYFYDSVAIAEESKTNDVRRPYTSNGAWELDGRPVEQHHGGEPRNGNGAGSTRNRRTVWTIATQPYKGAHFATFPEKLVEPCILAGTSPKACGVCGAPWERMVQRGALVSTDGTKDTYRPTKTADDARVKGRSEGWTPNHMRPIETRGWRPTCDHNDDTGKCIVLDPFCGSGTVGVVAAKHGRRFVGIDLSGPYLKLAQERTSNLEVGLGI